MSKIAFFWAIMTALVWGVVPIIEKLGLSKVNVETGLFIRCIGVILGAIVLLIFKFNELKLELVNVSAKTVILLLLGGFLASVVGQLFFYRALKLGEVSRAVPIAAAYPLFAFILALLFLGEKFTLAKFLGLCLVLLGLVLLR